MKALKQRGFGFWNASEKVLDLTQQYNSKCHYEPLRRLELQRSYVYIRKMAPGDGYLRHLVRSNSWRHQGRTSPDLWVQRCDSKKLLIVLTEYFRSQLVDRVSHQLSRCHHQTASQQEKSSGTLGGGSWQLTGPSSFNNISLHALPDLPNRSPISRYVQL